MKEKIIGYKVRVRGHFKLNNEAYMVIWESLIRKPLNPHIYASNTKCYFSNEENEIVIKININGVGEEIIRWNEYMKYKMMKLDKKRIKSWYERNITDFNNPNFNYPKEDIEYYKNKSYIHFSDFVPFSKKFKDIIKENNRNLIKIEILGIEEINYLTEKKYKFYQNMLENFE